MTHPSAIVFDLDGTLVHSAPDLHAAVNATLSEIGRAPLDLATVVSFVGNGAEVLMRRALSASGSADEADFADAMPRLMRAYAAQGTTLTRPYPGVVDTLEAIAVAGIAMGVCTNKPHDMAVQVCAELDLARFFPVILGATDDLPRKPDPAMLHHVIGELGGDAGDAVYVGDSAVDHGTAVNAAVRFRLFEGGYLHAPIDELRPGAGFRTWAPGVFGL